ncbi:MAG: hydroxymethylbilane synthase [Bacteroidota bacterium]
MSKTIRIGTRGSKLALWQAHFVQSELAAQGIDSELVIIKTKGDTIQHLSFDKIEGKGFFTKEIEDTLLRGDVDMAVHSMKDLPTTAPEGLVTTAVSERADPVDWLVVNPESVDKTHLLRLKTDAIIGTSSARRKAQLLDYRRDFQLKDIRGNVPTRLRKLKEGQFDAIVLAAAGLTRLEIDLSEFFVLKFDPREFVPAPAQGVLAYQCLKDDIVTRRILKQLHHSATAQQTNVERKVLKLLEGGCQMPLGVYCKVDKMHNFHVWAAKADAWNGDLKRVQFSASTHAGLAEEVVKALGK